MKRIFLFLFSVLLGVQGWCANYHHSIGGVVGTDFGVRYKGFFSGTSGLGLQADLMVRLSTYGKAYSTITTTKGDGFKDKVTYSPSKNTTGYYYNWYSTYYTFELTPNLFFQNSVVSWGWGSLDWFVGGGISFGLMRNWSIGSTTAKNVASALDYAYGYSYGYGSSYGHSDDVEYGAGYNKIGGKFGVNAMGGIEISWSKIPLAISTEFRPGYGMGFWIDRNNNVTTTTILNFFDWGFSASVRYCF